MDTATETQPFAFCDEHAQALGGLVARAVARLDEPDPLAWTVRDHHDWMVRSGEHSAAQGRCSCHQP